MLETGKMGSLCIQLFWGSQWDMGLSIMGWDTFSFCLGTKLWWENDLQKEQVRCRAHLLFCIGLSYTWAFKRKCKLRLRQWGLSLSFLLTLSLHSSNSARAYIFLKIYKYLPFERETTFFWNQLCQILIFPQFIHIIFFHFFILCLWAHIKHCQISRQQINKAVKSNIYLHNYSKTYLLSFYRVGSKQFSSYLDLEDTVGQLK